ncbi:hypothetical protein LNKW23_11900 [Paralimibaculum aggregatum]|uniref:Globin domain-containing protein n=1 Tax=Paralimibaculum aggregatum TaxID=3036245 RepID=A0ABQ6LF57_9RHOB|nr:globin family protein [Limibaculum sp. NKW23]GMG81977.1 hypothetical protein LNKW23_11900 [Limibaculum sp. NKW23]
MSTAPLTPDQVAEVQASFRRIVPIAPAAAEIFYDRLFAHAPHLRAMFPDDLAEQRRKLVAVLAMAVGALDRLESLLPTLHELGARHVGYGVEAAHYRPVGLALMETLELGLGPAWTPATEAAWAATYATLSAAMLEGAADALAAA